MCICALRGGLGGTVARRVPLVGLAVGFLVAFFVFSQKGHRRAKIREQDGLIQLLPTFIVRALPSEKSLLDIRYFGGRATTSMLIL